MRHERDAERYLTNGDCAGMLRTMIDVMSRIPPDFAAMIDPVGLKREYVKALGLVDLDKLHHPACPVTTTRPTPNCVINCDCEQLDANDQLNAKVDAARAMAYGGFGLVPAPPFNDAPLDNRTPAAWTDKEKRVGWVLANFTDGEKAYLYRLLNAEGHTLSSCAAKEAKERK